MVILEGWFAITRENIELIEKNEIKPLAILVDAGLETRAERRNSRMNMPGYTPLVRDGNQIQLMDQVYNPSWANRSEEVKNLANFIIVT